ncbi:3-oxoacyl-(acyl-carrier-protein) synthase [Flavobacterium aquaticum]|uniref:3-oxoacyl-(Acyl-carrier-protein) synthase n=1 Tax=Flavobacterium aquaticum TaxID=1236486 RepID=A0A327YWD0_9FLAO|nr:beta-ketoacyl synthase N-terminal-like domain-containing protein [Flavobacterium aquaticum]RAK24981.1 3-oxoacyl-(acyl-carrier-protein) synthase [Flavobacterium aquaticum]
MQKCYINGMGCVSSQETYDTSFLESVEINTTENIVYAKQPSYKELIPPAAARRMAKGVKMGLAASTKALKEANVEVPDAIITGTGMGCIEDSEKFLKALIDNNEEYLTPTNFIQSTHNTVGAQIALGLGCKGYNFTYVNGSISFESALLDAKLQLENEEENTILVGAADETSSHTMELFKLVNIIKKESDQPYSVLDSNSSGVVYSEGATFVTLENVKKENSYAVLEALQIQNELNIDEVESFISSFLEKNNLKIQDIDVVVLGNNGDISFDTYYTAVDSLFDQIPQVYYKHLSGEFNTASAFGFWVAASILKNQAIPQVVKMNSFEKANFSKVLLYNQFQGKDHSLVLLSKC